MAGRYKVVNLEDLAKEKFKRSCRYFWDTPDFPVAAFHALTTTPDLDNGLRSLVSQTIATRMGIAQRLETKALLIQFDGLAVGILDSKSEELGWGTAESAKMTQYITMGKFLMHLHA